jgi:hypothetical protein
VLYSAFAAVAAAAASLLCPLLALSLLAASPARAADKTGEVDWDRRVVKARGQGAPDLNAPSISFARLNAEKAAKADALRNLLETLKGVQVTSGDQAGTLLQQDGALRARVEGALRGFKVVAPHYFADGGVALDVEVELDKLPPELRERLKKPAAGAAAKAVDEKDKTPAYQKGAASVDRPHKLLRARGQGMPDLLNSATVAVARQKAERAARIDAAAQLLRAIQTAGGAAVDGLLQADEGLRAKLDGALAGYQIVSTHYYSDGGVAFDVELPFDQLPAELAQRLQAQQNP